MLLIEFDSLIPEPFRSPDEDNSVTKLNDVRKTRLTLAQINRMRVMNDLRKFEKTLEIDRITRQYAAASEESEF